MHHLARYFHRLGLRVCLLSPAHLRWEDGRAQIHSAFVSGWPDAIVRFFPAEWLPNLRDQKQWWPYFRVAKTVLSNPATAIVLQTKRFPLIWNRLRSDLSTWRKMLPETREPAAVNGAFDDNWVLKPALGRAGEGVGIRGITAKAELSKLLRRARRHPEEWIAQKRFEILPMLTEAGLKYPCIGVFTIGGRAAGFYGRIADTPIINQNAQDAAVLVNVRQRGEVH
jgi:glutathionylspermidine synthase